MRTISGSIIILLALLIFSCGTVETSKELIKPYSGVIIHKDYQYTKTFFGTQVVDFNMHLENIADSDKSAKLAEELIYQNKSFDDYAEYLETRFDGTSNEYPLFYNDDGTHKIFYLYLTENYNIIFHDEKFLLIKYHTEYYTGGAHGNYLHKYYTIDIDAGKLLEIDDLIVQIPESVLSRILSADYDTDSFFQRDIWPPDTITFNTEGVELFWNVYTITPYAMGPVSAVIPYPTADSYLTNKGNQLKKQIINKD